MKNVIYTSVLVLSIAAQNAFSQNNLNDQVLFTVANDTVMADEYIAVYNKNRNVGQDIDPKTPTEYLDLYVNFKLKVHEAKTLGKDTAKGFIREYKGYRDQLAKPYLSDKDVTGELVQEAYDRMKMDVRASHIMLALSPDAAPADTLNAYNTIAELRKEIVSGKVKFEDAAKENSGDTYSAKRGGDLGYFTVFNMVYPFETAAYETPTGEISAPVRSRFGYHIIKPTDKREARGEVGVSHIMLISNEKSTPEQQASAEKKINELYESLKNGEDFTTLAKQHSQDNASASRGGVLQPFGINKMYPEFEEAAFSLKQEGQFSKPIKTKVGWHIIRLNQKAEIPTFEEAKAELKSKVERDSRIQQSKTSIVKRLKKDYNFNEDGKFLISAFDKFEKAGNPEPSKYTSSLRSLSKKAAFSFAEKSYTLEDVFAEFRLKNTESKYYLAYKNFSEIELLKYEKEHLEEKYPEFKLLSREYYEGILLFDLTEETVWRKSVSDSVGLEEYYNNHKSDYMWGTRYNTLVINAADKKLAKKAQKMIKKSKTTDQVLAELNEESELNIDITKGLYEKKDHPALSRHELKKGFSDNKELDERIEFIYISEVIPPTQKSLTESRGAVISDYQDYLEQNWIKELKSKYQVKVNDDVLKKVVKKLESEA